MGSTMKSEMYEGERMDSEIDRDVDELRSLMSRLSEPAEPHPAYWNNFLLRVHERIEAETAPKRRAWWSPALIWSSLTGAAALVIVAAVTGILPFGGTDDPVASPAIAEGGTGEVVIEKPVETTSDMDLVPMDQEMENLIADIDEVSTAADDHMVLTSQDIEMLDAIESGDDDAILEAMMKEDLVGI